MPVIHNIRLSLKTTDVLRRQGFRRGTELRPRINLLIRELLTSLEQSRLLEPAAAYKYYKIGSMNNDQISLGSNKTLHGALLPAVFPQAEGLGVVVTTIGSKLEKQVAEYSQQGAALQAVTLDGIGSAAVDKLVSEVVTLIATEVSSRGYEISGPVNPGMPGFPLTEQWNLLGLVSAGEIGVSLTGSGVLVPRKSTSMVIGIGPQMIRWTQAEVCARCSLRESCPYKVIE
jgi:hypothetical protein